MDLEKIKEIIQLMNQEDLAEVEIEEEGQRIKLRKKEGHILKQEFTSVAENTSKASETEEVEKDTFYIKAPMVGTFYRAPAPDAAPFVEVGDDLNSGDTVCIIEAMKLMNEIKSEFKGKVVEILVENGDPVDYGQALFKIKSAG